MKPLKTSLLALALLGPAGCKGCSETPPAASSSEAPSTSGSKDGGSTATATSETDDETVLRESGALGAYGKLPVPADYEPEAEARIDAQNYRETLERLERDFATE